VQGERKITAVVGDITTIEADAIVNAANNELWMGSGVAGAIKRAGGEEIEQEAIAKGPIRIGEAVATSAGRLPHRRVIHAAAMGFEDGQMIGASDESVKEATESALRIADEEGMTSIAFPALGTGVGGLEIDECAKMMVLATAEYLRQPDAGLRQVVFVLRDENIRQTFEDMIKQVGHIG
jgi:O-acetyl-ADP-ribose deacetylase